MPRRRNNDLWDELLTSPWWVSVVLAVVVYVGIKWLLPSFTAHNIFLRGIAQAMYGVAWVTLPFILVAGAAAFISYRRRDLLDSRTGLESPKRLQEVRSTQYEVSSTQYDVRLVRGLRAD